MAWDFGVLQKHASEIVGGVGPESVDVYRFLAKEFAAGAITQNYVFQFAFRCFYGLDRAGLKPEFKREYFHCMEESRGTPTVDINHIASQLKPFKSLRDRETLQFSFITKLANMVCPEYPIWDSNVARLLHLSPYSTGSYEQRLAYSLGNYELMRSLYRELESTGLAHELIAAFRGQYDVASAEVPDLKVLDFVLWTAGGKGLRLKRA